MPRQLHLLASVFPALVLGLTVGVAPAGAQTQAPRLEVIPRLGVHLPLVDLGKARIPGELFQVRGELEAAFAAGFAVQYNLAALPAGFRATFEYATRNLSGLTRAKGQLAVCQAEFITGCESVGMDARFFAVTGDIVVRPRMAAGRAQLYFLIGAGIKRYEFAGINCVPVGDPDLEAVCEVFDVLADTQTNPTVHLAVGLDLGLGPLRTLVELGDYMSRFHPEGVEASGEIQHDLFLTAGLRVGVL